MERIGLKYVTAIGLISFVISCGNANKISKTDPEFVETTPVEQDNGSMTIETMSGADPSMNEPVLDELTTATSGTYTAIEWLDFETAIDRNKVEKKYIFIDMYTDWCVWCKKMDASTFKQQAVIDFMSENFYAVKMNPESKEAIAYKEVLYESKAYGQKMYNELAVNLLAGKMSFPSFVVLNKREVKRGVIVGYQTESQLISTLKGYLE